MAPSLDGSYEGAPPALRSSSRGTGAGARQPAASGDRRLGGGLTPMARAHLGMGASAYLVSAIWAASLAVGMVLALQGTHVIPTYFLIAGRCSRSGRPSIRALHSACSWPPGGGAHAEGIGLS